MGKRIFDIIFSLFVLFIFVWLLLISWLIAAIDTHSNGIFIQQRIGQYGATFKIYKFRTIRFSPLSGEGHISKIGRMLRNYKLDEFPQFLNVLKGEMSIVGPRPDLPGYYDLLEGENRKILQLKPGLTSLASIKYLNEEQLLEKQELPLIYNDLTIFPDKVRLNLDYYYTRNFWGDIILILKTVSCAFFRKK